jgi:hypothetical protein
MTALVGGAVERTFSTIGGFLTGLPGAKTQEPCGQNLRDLGYMAGTRGIHWRAVHWRVMNLQQTEQHPLRPTARIGLPSAAKHGDGVIKLQAAYLPK